MTDPIVPPYRAGDPSSSLLVRVRTRQDQAAWDRLVHLYTPLVLSWCRKKGLSEADALDVGQEVFLAVWRNIQTFHRDHPQESFRGWLRVITRSKIVDHRRKEGQKAPGGSEAPTIAQRVPQTESSDDDRDRERDRAEASLIYHRAVALIQNEFEPTTWLAFEAVVLNGQSTAETAAKLAVSKNVVYLAKSRVLKRLREEFEGLIET